MKKLGTPQGIVFLCYLDCKERSKRKHGLPKANAGLTADERLIRFALENSSIVADRESERAYYRVSSAVSLICKNLCPGQWCPRSHCKDYSLRHAYHCTKTRPAVCADYKKYAEKRNSREATQ